MQILANLDNPSLSQAIFQMKFELKQNNSLLKAMIYVDNKLDQKLVG